MARPRQTPEEIEAMRQRILGAAHELLHGSGMSALTMRAIAERLGVSPMTLYNYYPRRDALLDALREHLDQRVLAHQEQEYREAAAGDVRSVVERTLCGFGVRARENPRVYRLIFVEPVAGSAEAPGLERRFTAMRRHLTRLIALGVERGEFHTSDPAVAATAVLCIVNAPLILHCSGRLPEQDMLECLEREAVDIAMSYLSGDLEAPAYPIPVEESVEP